jgi:hypothetical protein
MSPLHVPPPVFKTEGGHGAVDLVSPLSISSSPAPIPRHQKPGGGRRDRTDDLLLAKQALSRLSYAPNQRTEDRRQMSDKNRNVAVSVLISDI